MRHYIKLTTRPSRGQSFTDWSRMWENTLDMLVPFVTGGSFRGWRRDTDMLRMHLPANHRLGGADLSQWREDNEACLINYVVYSYSTPIAWHRTLADGLEAQTGSWYYVGQKFSPTTSKHQTIIRRFASL